MDRKISENGYVFIKPEGYWVLEHRYVWEKYHGEIPKGYFVHHLDGNKQNNILSNLTIVSRKAHGKIHQLPNRIRIKYPNGVKVSKVETRE